MNSLLKGMNFMQKFIAAFNLRILERKDHKLLKNEFHVLLGLVSFYFGLYMKIEVKRIRKFSLNKG